MKIMRRLLIVVVMFLSVSVFIDPLRAETASPKMQPEKSDRKMIERGRYLTKIGGCNDCHTPGYLLREGNVPQKKCGSRATCLAGADHGERRMR